MKPSLPAPFWPFDVSLIILDTWRSLAVFTFNRSPNPTTNMTRKSVLHIEQILDWADAHFERTGQWPEARAGLIRGTLDEKWHCIDSALRFGSRGLRKGSSLARLLAEQRGKRNRKALPRLTLKGILAWADVYHVKNGKWPNRECGPIDEAPGETWNAVELALSHGQRGLPGGSSLAKLFARRRGVENRAVPRLLSREMVLSWADIHHARTGMWPTVTTGTVAEAPWQTWRAVDKALRNGRRGLKGRSSLARLLERQRGVLPGHRRLAPLSIELVLDWADAHHRRHGRWPNVGAGPVPNASGDSWETVNNALRQGGRGLRGGSSLAKLLAEHRGLRYHLGLQPLTPATILAWADAYHRTFGKWPTRRAGPVDGAANETWSAIEVALSHGHRGLPGGSTLPRLLQEFRGLVNRAARQPLSVRQILAWIDAHHERTGVWPRATCGPIAEAPGETWSMVEHALQRGSRGLGRGSSLAGLLRRHRGVGRHVRVPPLSIAAILSWADAHRKRTGAWPKLLSGPIEGAAGETWQRVENALREGKRGMAKGGSLARLLFDERGVRSSAYSPSLSEKQILAWADAHRQKHGKWPAAHTGAVEEAPAEKWINIDYALRAGARGLRGGSSLSRLLAREGRRRSAGR